MVRVWLQGAGGKGWVIYLFIYVSIYIAIYFTCLYSNAEDQ